MMWLRGKHRRPDREDTRGLALRRSGGVQIGRADGAIVGFPNLLPHLLTAGSRLSSREVHRAGRAALDCDFPWSQVWSSMVTEQGAVACRGVGGRVRSPMDKTAMSAGVTPSTGRACDHLDDGLAGFAVFTALGPNITLSLGLAAAGSLPATDPRRASPKLTLRRGCRCVDGRLSGRNTWCSGP